MYATVITLNPGNPLVTNVLQSRYIGHQAVKALTGKQERVLWRIDPGIYPELTVRSPARPRLESFLSRRPNYAVDVSCEKFEPDLREGQVLRFQVEVNPVKRVLFSGHKRAREGDSEIYQWLTGYLSNRGVEVLGLSILQKQGHKIRRKGQAFRLFVADVAGDLRVVDPECFRAAVYDGIGRSGAFGCGLLKICDAVG